MSTVIWIILAVVIGYFTISFIGYSRRFPSRFNIALGKATFNSLTPDMQQSVARKALEIINRTWMTHDFKDSNFVEDAHRFGWYALAMAEMQIPPIKNSAGDRWRYVRRPHLYPYERDSILDDLLARLRKYDGIEVDFVFLSPKERIDKMTGGTMSDRR